MKSLSPNNNKANVDYTLQESAPLILIIYWLAKFKQVHMSCQDKYHRVNNNKVGTPKKAKKIQKIVLNDQWTIECVQASRHGRNFRKCYTSHTDQKFRKKKAVHKMGAEYDHNGTGFSNVHSNIGEFLQWFKIMSLSLRTWDERTIKLTPKKSAGKVVALVFFFFWNACGIIFIIFWKEQQSMANMWTYCSISVMK